MQIELAEGFSLDPEFVLTGRCCVIGQSGSGKSYLVGVVAEELCKSKHGFVIIDTEGEYKSLKSLSNVITVGNSETDLDLDVDYSKLINASIESGTPIVLDVSESFDRVEQVYRFLDTLYNIEEKLRTPYLVIIEEADAFVPQITKGRINVIEEISVRGRKRGIGLMVATQRPANISKNVLAQCSYGFIGKLTIENDILAVKTLLEDRERLSEISKLNTGEFIPFGVQMQDKFRVKERSVKHIGATPKLRETLEQGNIDEIISTLKNPNPKQKKRIVQEPQKQGIVFVEQQGIGYANEIARKLLKKKFLLFGEGVENIDTISKKYMPISIADLRLPTGKRNEYDERSIIFSEGKLLRISSKIEEGMRFAGNVSKLGSEEKNVLRKLRGKKKMKIYELEEGIAKPLEKIVSVLEKNGLIEDKGEYINAVDYKQFLLESLPQSEKRDIDANDIVGHKNKKTHITELAKTIFPDSQVLDVYTVYLPFYEIMLRGAKNKVRIFKIDAIFGKEMK